MYQINSEDANFLYLENADSPTHISLIYFYDQSDMDEEVVRFTHIRQHIENRLYSAPVFRQKLHRVPGDIDYPYWVDDEHFDLDYHIRHLALPKPGDWRQFCIQVARLHSRPLDIQKPLWELYVIEGLDHFEGFPPGSFALYFKVHHCAMDEFTARELLQSLHSIVPDKTQHKSVQQNISRLNSSKPSSIDVITRAAFNNTKKSLKLYWQVMTNLRTVTKIAVRMAEIGVSKREQSPGTTKNRFSQALSSSRVFEGGFYQISPLNYYASQVSGATLTHVIAAICGEALSRYLKAHKETANDPSLSAWIEADIRNPGAHALAGNRIGLKRVELYNNIEHPVDRLLAIVAASSNLRSEEDDMLTSFKLRSLYEHVPSPALALLGRYAHRRSNPTNRMLRTADFGLSEVPGASRDLYMLGAKLQGFTTISPLFSGCGLIFSATTHLDKVGITFTSDASIMPDPEFMQECVMRAYEQLTLISENQAEDVSA